MSLCGEIILPGDKSLLHRAVIFSSIANGVSKIETTSLGRDNLATIRIMRQLGVAIEGGVSEKLLSIAREEGLGHFSSRDGQESVLKVSGQGFKGLAVPREELFCGNSGTTARLLCGLLAGRSFSAQINGDSSLVTRPFRRVTEPLGLMGARFSGDHLPLTVLGCRLKGIDFVSPKASAQVKTAILLAGLQAEGPVSVTEPFHSRDHTERMLTHMGCVVESQQLKDGSWKISLPPENARAKLEPIDIRIPGDFSSAAFFIVASCVTKSSRVVLRDVGFNPTRIGLCTVLQRMGAKIKVRNRRDMCGEEIVDLEVEASALKGTEIGSEEVVSAIDEIPILAVAAAFADGETRISGAHELRVKESDRLAMTAVLLSSFGVEVEEFEDGLRICGDPELGAIREPLSDLSWKTSGDHRIAMCGAVMENAIFGEFSLEDKAAVETSFPGFGSYFRRLIS